LIHKLGQNTNIVDVAMPLSHNVESTEREKIQKHQNLAGEKKYLEIERSQYSTINNPCGGNVIQEIQYKNRKPGNSKTPD
jgi:hypothetical protein